MNEALKITLIVPTRNRHRDLDRCLGAVRLLARAPDEVIVIIGPGDSVSHEVYRQHGGEEAKWHCLDCPAASVVTALNQGIRESSGDVVVFIDDDSEPPPDWLGKLEAHYLRDPRVVGVGGRDRILYPDYPELTHITNPPPAKVVGKVLWNGTMAGNHHCGSVRSPVEVDFIKGVNFSFRKAALVPCEIDPYLVFKGAEIGWEIDICLSLRRRGGTIIYDNDVWLYHHDGKRMPGDERSNFSTEFAFKRVDNQAYLEAKYLPWHTLFLCVALRLALGSRYLPGVAWIVRHVLQRNFEQLRIGMRLWPSAFKGWSAGLCNRAGGHS